MKYICRAGRRRRQDELNQLQNQRAALEARLTALRQEQQHDQVSFLSELKGIKMLNLLIATF